MTADQRRIAELCARYRVLTVEALTRAEELEVETPAGMVGLSAAAARSAITRMVSAKLLCVALRLPERALYQLTPQGAAAIGAVASAGRPLQAQGIRRRYGILAWSRLGTARRKLLTPGEFATFYGAIAEAPGIDASQQDYFRIKGDDGETVLLVQVTLDNNAQPASVVSKCRGIILRAQRIPSFNALLAEQRFRLVVLTATEGKARHIDKYLQHLRDRGDALLDPVEVEVLSRLLDIPGG